MRAYHVSKYAGVTAEKIGIHTYKNLFYETLTVSKVRKACWWYFSFQAAIALNQFRKTRYDTSWIIASFQEGLQALFLPDKKNYFYISLSSSSYYSAFFISELLHQQVSFITSNSPLYRPMRYTYLPCASVKLCSAYQEEEMTHYLEKKWIACKDHELWGLEEDIDLDRNSAELKYDIIIFSSAEWARNEMYWREKDLTKLKEGISGKQVLYRLFDEMVLDSVIELKKEKKDLKVILLPHPYERELQQKHEIDPPYLQKLTENGIEYNATGTNSLGFLKNTRTAVAECSTIIFDCWHHHIPAFTFSGKKQEAVFKVDYDTRYLGEYIRYCFDDKEDLKLKLKNVLQNG